MEKILFVNACVRPESRTLILARHILERLHGEVEEVDLQQEPLLPLNRQRLEERDTLARQNNWAAPVFRHARQFAAADQIIVAAPYWDLMFPALLKIYMEAVTVCGLTFHYTPEGRPEGLCHARRLIYVTTAGGYTAGKDFGFDYIRSLATSFYGIPEIHCCRAEGLDIWGNDPEAILAAAIAEADRSLPNTI